MRKYLATNKHFIEQFKHFHITRIPRSENQKVDALSKLTSLFALNPRSIVIVEEISKPSIINTSIDYMDEVGDNCITPIKEYHQFGTFSSNKKES